MSMSFARSAVVLGLLASVGPFSIDMYLPALPEVATDLDASIAAAQTTLTAFFIAFGLFQIVFGPLADRYGRKPPLYAGLTLVLLGSIGCVFATSIEALVFFRVIQGIGGASVMVVPRAIIRDMHTGTEATRLMALIMLVISVSPLFAPLTGSALIVYFDWRAIFGVLAVLAILSLMLTRFVLPETLKPQDIVPINLKTMMAGTKTLMTDRGFMGLTFIGAFGFASFIVFLASASFIYTGHYGLTPIQFSLAFAANAFGFIGASQFAPMLGMKYGMARVILFAVIGYAVFAFLLLGAVLAGFSDLTTVMVLLFFTFACQGLILPTTMVMALDDHGEIAGLASSLGGTLQMVSGGLVIAAFGPFFDGTPTPMVAAIAMSSLVALVLALLTVARRRPVSQPAE